MSVHKKRDRRRKMNNEKQTYCKKLILESQNNEIVVWGIVEEETENSFNFITGSGRKYTVSKKTKFVLLPTTTLFIKGLKK